MKPAITLVLVLLTSVMLVQEKDLSMREACENRFQETGIPNFLLGDARLFCLEAFFLKDAISNRKTLGDFCGEESVDGWGDMTQHDTNQPIHQNPIFRAHITYGKDMGDFVDQANILIFKPIKYGMRRVEAVRENDPMLMKSRAILSGSVSVTDINQKVRAVDFVESYYLTKRDKKAVWKLKSRRVLSGPPTNR